MEDYIVAIESIKFYSEVLGKDTEICVILPQDKTNGKNEVGKNGSAQLYKSLLLLHGQSDDQTSWTSRTSIEKYATEHGIAVIMPSADLSYYTNMKHGDRYYDFIAHEVPKKAHELFPISNKREDSFIAGNSMGGYGALKIGMREADRFSAIVALSPVVDIHSRAKTGKFFEDIFGEDLQINDDDDLYYLFKSCSVPPKVYIGIGKEDFLYDDNQKFKNYLESIDFKFFYKESSGDHCWQFWDEYIQYGLNWLLK